MEENIQNQPEEITNDILDEGIDIDLDQDYVIDWDKNWEEDAIQEREAEEVPLGERAEDSPEMDGGLRESSEDEGEYEIEGEQEDEVDEDYGVELGQIEQYEDEDDDPRYEQDEEDEYYDEDEDYDEDDDYELDESWQKMIDFMDEYPGATPEDYVRMTSGGEGMSDEDVLKMHLAAEHGLDWKEDADELDFLFEDKFGFDEELDSERDIKLKKLEAKKALRSAREQLSETQLKYGAELKFGDSSPELKELQAFQQEQVEFQQQNEELAKGFQDATYDYFDQEFKGFEFNYGDGQSQRIKADPQKTADFQSDITNFIEGFVGDNGQIDDLAGYHKALWAAQNADALFSHAYEQGKADAVRSAARSAKNIDMDPRSDRSAEYTDSNSGFKLIDDDSHTEDFKFNF